MHLVSVQALRSLQVTWGEPGSPHPPPTPGRTPLPHSLLLLLYQGLLCPCVLQDLAPAGDVTGTEGATQKHGDCGDCRHRCAGHHLPGLVCSLGGGLQAALLPASRPVAAL